MTAGTPVQLEIRTVEHEGALLVPAGAVVHELDESFLYVVDAEGHARRRQVEIGITTSTDAEILKGIVEGDRVIVQGQEALPDGAAVTVEGS